jgi:hypothetical protein
MAAAHKSILAALRRLQVATSDARIAVKPATMPIPIATGVGGPRNPPATAMISIPSRMPTSTTNQLIICGIIRK